MKFNGTRLFIVILCLFVCFSGLVFKASDSTGDSCAPTVCADCHSYPLCGSTEWKYLRQVDWNMEKHGLSSADDAVVLNVHAGTPPELVPRLVFGGTLLCTDCHGEHGFATPNAYLLKNNVNGIDIGNHPIPRFAYNLCSFHETGTKAMGWFCRACHKDDAWNPMTPTAYNMWQQTHHYLRGGTDYPYNRTRCYNCHTTSAGGTPINCECCHYHRSMTTDYGTNYPCYIDSLICRTPYDRRTF